MNPIDVTSTVEAHETGEITVIDIGMSDPAAEIVDSEPDHDHP